MFQENKIKERKIEEKPLNNEVHQNDRWMCKETESGRSK